MSLSEDFKETLEEKLLELVWRQWRTLGLPSHGPESGHLLDVEVLILAAAVMAEYDHRLWTGALEWLSQSREWVNRSRLNRIAEAYIKPDRSLNAPLVEKHIWQEAISSISPLSSSSAAASNKSRDDQVNTRPPLKKPSLLQLNLRGVFGVNARAELYLYLKTKGEGNSNQIAREIQYDQKNIYLILERWADAGFVSKENRGKRNIYSLEAGKKLTPSLDTANPFWEWSVFYALFLRLHVAAHRKPWASDSYLLSSFFKDLYPQSARLAKSAGISLPDPQLYPGEQYFAPASLALQSLFIAIAD